MTTLLPQPLLLSSLSSFSLSSSLDYMEQHPSRFPPSAESGRGLKEVLVTYHSRALWWDLAKQVGFHAIDTNGDGVLCRKEVEAATRVRFFLSLSFSMKYHREEVCGFVIGGHLRLFVSRAVSWVEMRGCSDSIAEIYASHALQIILTPFRSRVHPNISNRNASAKLSRSS